MFSYQAEDGKRDLARSRGVGNGYKRQTYTRGDYNAALPSWELVADVVAGEEKVKAKGESYLPNPSAVEEDPGEKKAVYDRYKQRASFFNVTGNTPASHTNITLTTTTPDHLTLTTVR